MEITKFKEAVKEFTADGKGSVIVLTARTNEDSVDLNTIINGRSVDLAMMLYKAISSKDEKNEFRKLHERAMRVVNLENAIGSLSDLNDKLEELLRSCPSFSEEKPEKEEGGDK